MSCLLDDTHTRLSGMLAVVSAHADLQGNRVDWCEQYGIHMSSLLSAVVGELNYSSVHGLGDCSACVIPGTVSNGDRKQAC